jgi:galactokinase
MLTEGEGSNYAYTVAKRLLNNINDAGLSRLFPGNVKSVFYGDIPFGGGTSGSSAKLIADFFILATVNNLLSDDEFVSLVIENGKQAGLKMGSRGVNDLKLALSMYLAHHENGFDFGNLKGDRGVGTFGGSEDHTAIVLGERDTLLYCRYCPTEVLEKIKMPEDHLVVVGYSGKKAEKTKEAMLKYNRLSEEAAAAVKQLNIINQTGFDLLRDFFCGQTPGKKADLAYEQLSGVKDGLRLAERAYQFFRETEVTEQAVSALVDHNITEFGKLINESHDLSKKYLRNIVAEVDWLQQSANELGALGATGFGAGFGGSCYAVIPEDQLDGFILKWKKEYVKKYPQYRDTAGFDVYTACGGVYWERLRFK